MLQWYSGEDYPPPSFLPSTENSLSKFLSWIEVFRSTIRFLAQFRFKDNQGGIDDFVLQYLKHLIWTDGWCFSWFSVSWSPVSWFLARFPGSFSGRLLWTARMASSGISWKVGCCVSRIGSLLVGFTILPREQASGIWINKIKIICNVLNSCDKLCYRDLKTWICGNNSVSFYRLPCLTDEEKNYATK